MGLDGLALCGAVEDFTFLDELNFEGLDTNEAWYDQMKGSEMKMLFNEHRHSRRLQKSHRSREASRKGMQRNLYK